MQVHVVVDCAAEALDQGDRAGLGRFTGKPRFLHQMPGDAAGIRLLNNVRIICSCFVVIFFSIYSKTSLPSTSI